MPRKYDPRAGEFVRKEFESPTPRSREQKVAIGLSRARRAGLRVPPAHHSPAHHSPLTGRQRAKARRDGRQAAKDLAATAGMGAVQQSLAEPEYWASEARRLGVAAADEFSRAARATAERLLSPALAPARKRAIITRALAPLRKAFKAAAMRERKANAELTHALWAASAPRSTRYDPEIIDRLDRAWDDTLNEYRGAMVALRMAVEKAKLL
jgi:hypothetical protein